MAKQIQGRKGDVASNLATQAVLFGQTCWKRNKNQNRNDSAPEPAHTVRVWKTACYIILTVLLNDQMRSNSKRLWMLIIGHIFHNCVCIFVPVSHSCPCCHFY
uniref:Uncharacterized protein n=1 Tax=Gopherus agassizii TaxID=38772 RepID=A0A452HID6_9SAUR